MATKAVRGFFLLRADSSEGSHAVIPERSGARGPDGFGSVRQSLRHAAPPNTPPPLRFLQRHHDSRWCRRREPSGQSRRPYVLYGVLSARQSCRTAVASRRGNDKSADGGTHGRRREATQASHTQFPATGCRAGAACQSVAGYRSRATKGKWREWPAREDRHPRCCRHYRSRGSSNVAAGRVTSQ